MTHQSFNYIANAKSRILILGSMPGEKSLAAQQYYAHPQNAFWKIMQTITNIPFDADYQRRTAGLLAKGIALWDVLASCQREGSLDSNIEASSIQINDFQRLFEQLPQLKLIALNGGKAFQLFERHIVKAGLLPSKIDYAKLPSTSPAYASLRPEHKAKLWHQQLAGLL